MTAPRQSSLPVLNRFIKEEGNLGVHLDYPVCLPPHRREQQKHQANEALTDPIAREKFMRTGHPDGYQVRPQWAFKFNIRVFCLKFVLPWLGLTRSSLGILSIVSVSRLGAFRVVHCGLLRFARTHIYTQTHHPFTRREGKSSNRNKQANTQANKTQANRPTDKQTPTKSHTLFEPLLFFCFPARERLDRAAIVSDSRGQPCAGAGALLHAFHPPPPAARLRLVDPGQGLPRVG